MDKKRISTIFGRISIVLVFTGCVEGIDGGLTAWTIICLVAALAAGLFSKKLDEA